MVSERENSSENGKTDKAIHLLVRALLEGWQQKPFLKNEPPQLRRGGGPGAGLQSVKEQTEEGRGETQRTTRKLEQQEGKGMNKKEG